MPRESNSAVDAARLERLGFCIAGLKQPLASGGETTEAVAKRSGGVRGRWGFAVPECDRQERCCEESGARSSCR